MAPNDVQTRATGPRQAFLLTLGLVAFWMAVRVPAGPARPQYGLPESLYGRIVRPEWGLASHLHGSRPTCAGAEVRPGASQLWPFVRPPVYAIVVAPLALMPFPMAFGSGCRSIRAVPRLLGVGMEAIRSGGGHLGSAFLRRSAGHHTRAGWRFASGLGLRRICAREKRRGCSSAALFLAWVDEIPSFPTVAAGNAGPETPAHAGRILACGLGQGCSPWRFRLEWRAGYAGFILHLDRYYSPEKNIDMNAILLNIGISSRPLLVIVTVWCRDGVVAFPPARSPLDDIHPGDRRIRC